MVHLFLSYERLHLFYKFHEISHIWWKEYNMNAIFHPHPHDSNKMHMRAFKNILKKYVSKKEENFKPIRLNIDTFFLSKCLKNKKFKI